MTKTWLKIFLVASIIILLVGGLFYFVEARQGCCSWHGGVCGCQCCNGTPLSAKCAPYYPWCNGEKEIYTPLPSPPSIEPIRLWDQTEAQSISALSNKSNRWRYY
ncbi:MAG: hypothetical protein AB1414_01250 [bacterium]